MCLLHYFITLECSYPLPGQDCGHNTTTSSKPCRVSPHIVRRRAVVLKDRFQATSLNKYLVIFVALRLNVIRRTNTTASARSKDHTYYPASLCLGRCQFKCIWRTNASWSQRSKKWKSWTKIWKCTNIIWLVNYGHKSCIYKRKQKVVDIILRVGSSILCFYWTAVFMTVLSEALT